jgi:RNA polymerase primary sigma factor
VLDDLVEDVLNALPERESAVLRVRFGLRDGTPRSLADTEQETGVTRERIEEIEAKALQLLRHPARRDALRAFLKDS